MNGTEKLPARTWLEINKALVDYRAGRFASAADVLVRVAPSNEGMHDGAGAASRSYTVARSVLAALAGSEVIENSRITAVFASGR